ncbi:BnaC03g14490D [Brassica napus]|uniref:BnaC03g14490D protein n=2 Tax=Brassica TaxID=3705 RepID=A0A078I1X5_BRANA|nr:BnaC03g14490D [Brassica napus]
MTKVEEEETSVSSLGSESCRARENKVEKNGEHLDGLVIVQVKHSENPCFVFAKLKRWERKKCKPNSLPVLHKMHVKFGDMVKVISGRDKGKIGEVTKRPQQYHCNQRDKDVNLKAKHMKSREEGEPGQILKVLDDGKIPDQNGGTNSIEKWKQLREAKDKERTTQVAVSSAS